MRVLVVEGQGVPRRMTAKMIRDCGVAEVLEADCGETALSILTGPDAAIDLLVTDLRLEGMDGVTFVRRVAEQCLAAHLILISNVEDALARTVMAMARNLNLDAAGHARKPATPEALRSLVQRLLVRRAASPFLANRPVHVTAEELRQGIEARQFVPFFQPRVRTCDGETTAVEALIRWQHPQRGLIPPGAFIPLADTAGLIDGITELVIDVSLAWAQRWRDAGIDLRVSVNLTESALQNRHFPATLVALARKYDIPADRILLEVTERDAVTEAPATLATLARLRLMEFGLSVDDFGTGTATEDQLARIPFTEAKIDQSLVTGVADQPQYVGVLAQTMQLARSLGLRTVAEGVESKADWDLLSELGCEEMQGFHVARPMPGEEIEGWAKGWHRQLL